MFLVLTYERNSEISPTVFTLQKACSFPVVEMRVIIFAEAEVALVVPAVMAVA